MQRSVTARRAVLLTLAAVSGLGATAGTAGAVTVDVTITGQGSVTVGDQTCEATPRLDTTTCQLLNVTVPEAGLPVAATARSGWAFSSFGGSECDGAPETCTIPATAPDPATVTASFSDVDPTITLGRVLPAARTNVTRATFAPKTEEDATITCTLDGRVVECTAEHELAEGQHVFSATAKDLAGNESPTARHTWVVDTTPPDTRILVQPSNLTRDDDGIVVFAPAAVAEGESVAHECDRGFGLWAPCTSPQIFTDLPESTHLLLVRTRDDAGNVDATPAVARWTVDQTPPELTLVGGPDDGSTTTETRAVFALGTEPGARLECTLNGDPHICGPRVVVRAELGRQEFEAIATDAAGNPTPTPVRRTWTVVAERPLPTQQNVVVTEERTGTPAGTESGTAQRESRVQLPRARRMRLNDRWEWRGDRTRMLRLTLLNVPRGTDVSATCRTRRLGCPRRVRVEQRQGRRVTIARSFRGRWLRPRATIEVRVEVPRQPVRVLRFTTRSRNLPRAEVLCGRPNSRRLRSCT